MQNIELIPNFLGNVEASYLFNHLSQVIPWHEELKYTDREGTLKLKRKMAYVSDEAVTYKYANLEFEGVCWYDNNEFGAELLTIKNQLESHLNVKFNSVLLNYYKDGKDSINWHSDKEESLGDSPTIAMINLGPSVRKFWYRKKEPDSEKLYLPVGNGDLLVMGPTFQQTHLHSILKEPEVTEPRISLTYRWNY